MKILITGNMGYVGSVLVPYLRKKYPKSFIAGLDIGFFAEKLLDNSYPEKSLDKQIIKDIRDVESEDLEGFDVIINLAAVSNDPMGKEFESATEEINFIAGVRLANLAKEVSVKKFIFASSCSVYGEGLGNSKTEKDQVNPLTEYAKSKINTENELEGISSPNFVIKCLRFATACGFSSRIRLDIVLNDFVVNGLLSNEINILSDGSPWRPLIHVEDMARAIHWSIEDKNKDEFQILNVGNLNANYQVKEIAEAVQKVLPTIKIKINENASPDKRSYKVDFSFFNNLASGYQPKFSLEESIKDIVKKIKLFNLNEQHIANSEFIRLKALKDLIDKNLINSKLQKL
jgi:nucleoside-diphosphate-sugar epimerase